MVPFNDKNCSFSAPLSSRFIKDLIALNDYQSSVIIPARSTTLNCRLFLELSTDEEFIQRWAELTFIQRIRRIKCKIIIGWDHRIVTSENLAFCLLFSFFSSVTKRKLKVVELLLVSHKTMLISSFCKLLNEFRSGFT